MKGDMNAPLTVAIARTPHSESLAECLQALGARLVSYGRNSETAGAVPLERWILQLIEGEFDDVVFTSAQGVHLIVEMAHQVERRDAVLDALGVTRKIARGKKPAQALLELGVSADITSRGLAPEALIDTLKAMHLEGRVVGIQPSDRATEMAVAAVVEEAGGVARLAAPTTTVDPEATALLDQLARGDIQAMIFLTERHAAWLFDACRVSGQESRLISTLRKLPVIAAEAATGLLRRRGVHPDLILSHATIMAPVAHDLSLVLGLGAEGHGDPAVAAPARAVGRHRVVIVGNGMVGYKLCDRLTEDPDKAKSVVITALGEESVPAYDRVHLSEYFSGKSAEDLYLEPESWYQERGVELRLGQRAARIDRTSRVVHTSGGEELPYDTLVLATGAAPFVPPVPGLDKNGVFLYRTVEDLVRIKDYAKGAKSAAVIGGGLLGLEAAKAAMDMGLETHVVEMASRVMPRQLDAAGAALLRKQIESIGVRVHLEKRTSGITGAGEVTGVRFADGERLPVDMIIVSAGIRPRDQVAGAAGLQLYSRGGILVDNLLRTSDENIYAIGECAIHEGVLYGLVAPGYEMASAVAKTILGEKTEFRGADMSTKLKLLGFDVASLGDPFADEDESTRTVVYQDLVKGIYKKLIVDASGKKLLGAILVGDTVEYATLLPYARSGEDLPVSPDELLSTGSGFKGGAALPVSDTAQVCSCNNVTRLDIIQAIDARPSCSVDELKKCTKAGTGCGGCMPLVTDLWTAQMKARGVAVSKALCEHFDYSRQELYDLIRVQNLPSFDAVIQKHGRGHGCEVCKPAVASILATTVADPIMNHQTLQDTNDRFLANIQRKGLYSVVPRIPGGEITPEKLIVIGDVAKKYGLYTKITGGQRIDLFGARVDQLPDIWEELVRAGFESGHAYGKALRTVKSCVGTTWCRFGVGDSVGFAVRVEERYKGIRAPHKLKSAVSGCTRECAEAQSKDFGLIATEKGWNLYICGNGGQTPRHADLLASDLDEATAIRYIDRFLMYYIRTADRLTRTSVWLEKIDGGIDHVRRVVVEDTLGIGAELEADMQRIVDAFVCEWKDVVENPEKRARFTHFAASTHAEPPVEPPVEMITERGQTHPIPWPDTPSPKVHLPVLARRWVEVARVDEVPSEGGTAFLYGKSQLALFRLDSQNKWFSTQNMCPHKREMVLSRGLVGDKNGAPKVACPIHKKSFDLESGRCLTDDDLGIVTFPVKVEGGAVFVELPPEAELEVALRASECESQCATAAE